ncbi:hypothetical protein GCM10009850_026260 [Nonomuraea monospora]|uniref:Thioredoxin domain-containing protein n=1 Tax=Nonomuraea monospora TaxID=568818 RepID=A0ABP5P9K0_9ACTN
MIAILSAALVLAWVAIALLAFGYAGLLGKVRELQEGRGPGTSQVNPELAARGPGSRSLALALTSTCSTCEKVFAEWGALAARLNAAGDRTTVVSMDDSAKWQERGATDVVLASELSSPFLIAYQPALLVFDERGALLSAEPIGSVEGLHALCEPFLEPVTI